MRVVARFLLVLCFWIPLRGSAQFVDRFSDGDFTNAPAWSGETARFVVNGAQQLQSAGLLITDTLYLYTPSTRIDSTEWQFWMDLAFQPSTTNFVRIYLVSNQTNLQGSLNGYFLEVGQTGTVDSLKFYRQTGTTKTLLKTGALGCFGGTANNAVRIRVRRDNLGNWEIYSDCSGGTNWSLEGTVADNTYSSTSYFGVYCRHTSTRADKFYFDDFYVGPWVTDITPPTLSSVTVVSSNQVDLQFSEPVGLPSSQTLANYNLNGGMGNPTTAVRDGVDASVVHLGWASNFTNATQYLISAANVADTAGNGMVQPDTLPFFYFVPGVSGFKSVIINEILADPDPVVGLPMLEFVEIFNRSSQYFDLGGWKFRDPSTLSTLPTHILAPGDYLILCKNADTTAFQAFGPTLGLSSLPSLNNAGDFLGLRDAAGVLIDSVAYDISWFNDPIKDDGGWTLELVRPSDTCSAFGNWRASMDVAGGTPGQINSVFDPSPDTQAPALVSLVALSSDSLELCFDETLDISSLSIPGNFGISGGIGAPAQALPQGPDFSCVILVLSTPLDTGITYTITANNLADCKGNAAGTLMGTVDLGGAGFKEVIFNEILADPDPVVGLPQAEFVELFNRGTRTIQLAGWKLRDASSVATLGNFSLVPGGYVIVCALADTADFSPFGPVIGVPTLPSLNNSGDNFGLRSNLDQLVDTLVYSISWFQDPIKDDGGWTLELIRPSDTCSVEGNWAASLDPAGGTPGQVNSVHNPNPDTQAPSLQGVTILGPDSIRVCFDETMDLTALSNATLFSLNGGIGNALLAIPIGPAYSCVDLVFPLPLDTGITYTLTLLNQSDCKGNAAGTLTASLDLGAAYFKAVIFTELFPDPDPPIGLPQSEFVELYNRSSASVDLQGWTFHDVSTSPILPAYSLAPGAYVILCLDADTAQFSPFGPVLGLSSFPSLNNSGDFLGLRDRVGQLIDTLAYTLDWYGDPDKDGGGWSLELIHLGDTCSAFGNWAASVDLDGGTPGQQNSIFSSQPDVFPPQVVSLALTGPDTLRICFNESMDSGILADETRYDIVGMGQPLIALPVAPDYACVDLVLPTLPDTGTVYVVNMTNLADCKGNPAAFLVGEFVLGGSALPFQIVINEIFPDPSPRVGLPEYEFVEIRNNGPGAVDLTGWNLGDRTGSGGTFPPATLLPNEYLILCATSSADSFLAMGNVLPVPGFPGLNNAGDSLELKNGAGNLMDFVYYADSWYQDLAKAEGGWTLERIDPGFHCSNQENWQASMAAAGGTPGTANSVAGTFSDNTPPEIISIRVLDPQMIRLTFSEPMNESQMLDVSRYQIDQGVGQPVASLSALSVPIVVDLLLPGALDSNKIYCLTATGVSDCPGNDPGSLSFCFGIPIAPDSGDVILNEILFNPYVGGSDYVELVNISTKILDLSQIAISKMEPGTDSVLSGGPIASVPTPFMPGDYLCLTRDRSFQLSTYLPPFPQTLVEWADLPTFDDTEGDCRLSGMDGTILDRFHYLDDYHFPNLDDKEGVSLERLSFQSPTQRVDNWHSAASTARYGTPGYQNSQSSDQTGSGSLTVTPETFSPDQDGQDDYVTIQYHFPEAGANARVRVYDNRGRLVRMLKENTLLGTEPNFFTWDGTDDAGHKVAIGIYVILFEVSYPANGKQEIHKLSCVVAAKF